MNARDPFGMDAKRPDPGGGVPAAFLIQRPDQRPDLDCEVEAQPDNRGEFRRAFDEAFDALMGLPANVQIAGAAEGQLAGALGGAVLAAGWAVFVCAQQKVLEFVGDVHLPQIHIQRAEEEPPPEPPDYSKDPAVERANEIAEELERLEELRRRALDERVMRRVEEIDDAIRLKNQEIDKLFGIE